MTYVISGSVAGLAGVVFVARNGTVLPTSGMGLELLVIAAVVVGGTNIFGGEGTIAGTALAAVLLQTITSAIVVLGVSTAWQGTVIGSPSCSPSPSSSSTSGEENGRILSSVARRAWRISRWISSVVAGRESAQPCSCYSSSLLDSLSSTPRSSRRVIGSTSAASITSNWPSWRSPRRSSSSVRGIDLSVAAVFALTAVTIGVLVVDHDVNIWLAMTVGTVGGDCRGSSQRGLDRMCGLDADRRHAGNTDSLPRNRPRHHGRSQPGWFPDIILQTGSG